VVLWTKGYEWDGQRRILWQKRGRFGSKSGEKEHRQRGPELYPETKIDPEVRKQMLENCKLPGAKLIVSKTRTGRYFTGFASGFVPVDNVDDLYFGPRPDVGTQCSLETTSNVNACGDGRQCGSGGEEFGSKKVQDKNSVASVNSKAFLPAPDFGDLIKLEQ
jgi:hypothetical protein